MRDGPVQLRRWEINDAEWYADTVVRDPSIQRFTSELPGLTADEVRTAIGELRAGAPGRAGYAIVRAFDGKLQGSIALSYADGVGEVSYWLAEGARGRGVATRAVRLLTAWAFTTLGLRELRLWSHAGNEASLRVAERAGFVRDVARDEERTVKGERWPIRAFVLAHPESAAVVEIAETVPFRWDLIRPDQLGRLVEGEPAPDLWFAPELTRCAGKVLARSGGGKLLFVGRSADSLFDVLSGALRDTDWRERLGRLAFSHREPVEELPRAVIERARELLAAAGVTPQTLARAERPVSFIDLVYSGATFTSLFVLLRAWVDEAREPWNAVRRKLRFVGVAQRQRTSPKVWRWQQHAGWAGDLPASAVINISLDRAVWSYLADNQPKLTRSFPPERWGTSDVRDPAHDEPARRALAEAVALVEYGRATATRRALVRAMDGEPALAEPWLRDLVRHLR